jgi:delta-aminolevulinic acid dehydratase/porphobilinogen synthase
VITKLKQDSVDTMTKNAIIILCGLLILSVTLPRVEAVICESFVTQDVCERTYTSSGGCRWVARNSTCVNDPSRILPAGYAAIASVDVPDFLADIPAPEVR